MVRLAGPLVLAELGWMLMVIVDTIMVGRVSPAAIGAVSLGGVLFYTVNKQATLSARAERIWIHEDDNPAKVFGAFVIPGSAIPAVSSNGWMLSFGGVVNF